MNVYHSPSSQPIASSAPMPATSSPSDHVGRMSARRSSRPAPKQSRNQLTRWLASSHQPMRSYRSRVLPVTSMRNGAITNANPAHGSGAVPPRIRRCSAQIAGTSSISTG